MPVPYNKIIRSAVPAVERERRGEDGHPVYRIRRHKPGLNRTAREVPGKRKEMQTVSNVLEYFQIQKRGSTVRTEVIAGATTFATMAYILIIQPKYMG